MIFKGPYNEVSVPEVPLTDFVLQSARERPNKPALIEGPSGRTITYGQLAERVERAAAGLADHGFCKGDVLGLLSPNLPEVAIAFLAVARLGGIITTINPIYTPDEIGHQLRSAGAKYVLTVTEMLGKAFYAGRGLDIREFFVFGSAAGATSFDELLESDGTAPTVNIDPKSDLVALPYSSGTTGLPKGVMLTHHNLVANMCQMSGLDYFTSYDTLICVLPLFHIYGLVVVMNMGLQTGATIVTMPRYDLEKFLETIQKYRVTLAHVVPPIVLQLAKHEAVDRYDLSCLKMLFSGAAPLGPELTQECISRIGCGIRQGYGMTETSPVTHSSPAESSKVKFGSIGPPAPNTEVKVADLETGVALPPHQEGEICVRGPQVMKGYLNQPEATALTIDPEGWLHTGDIGYADEDGHFFIVDRAKELIKYKGLQVAPAELEAVLLTHPAVADAAVIPCPDQEAGEVPKAFVVLKSDASEDEIRTFVTNRVAPYKKIRVVEFIDAIPKSASGKILRRVLIQQDRIRANTGSS